MGSGRMGSGLTIDIWRINKIKPPNKVEPGAPSLRYATGEPD